MDPIEKEVFSMPSTDGVHTLYCVRYKNTRKDPVGIIQISHGMVEYIERYEEFAMYMAQHGYIVVGNDHLGHGDSVLSKDEWGDMGKDGAKHVLGDLYALTQKTKEDYPGLTYILLGHSMGSFFARRYLFTYPDALDAAIIMGTGFTPKVVSGFGICLTKVLALFKGWKDRNAFVNSLAFGSYGKAFTPARTTKDWLSKNTENVDAYLKEERCSFVFTLRGYLALFQTLFAIEKPGNLEKMKKDLNILFVSGSMDPVGNMGKGVKKVVEHFKKLGMKNITMKLYDEDRHEILHEDDRQMVFSDILKWLENI